MKYLGMMMIVYFLHLMLKLNWIVTAIVLAIGMIAVLFWRKKYVLQKRQYQRFQETCLYLEMMFRAFLKSGKIDAALSDTAISVNPGPLKAILTEACDHIQLTFDESEVTADALEMIAKAYDCKRVKDLHDFMLRVEMTGGERREAIALMEEDENRWKMRIEDSIRDRKKSLREIVLSVIASLVICSCILYLPVMNLDISANVVTQTLSVVVIALDVLIIFGGAKFLNEDWIKLDAFSDEKRSTQRLNDYRNYDMSKGWRNSLLAGIPFMILSAICIILKHPWYGAFGLAVSFVVLNQHYIGQTLRRRQVQKEIRSAFPHWLVDLVLLLQTENVQVAIQKSILHAPQILMTDLSRLEQELIVDPESSQPYHHFLQDFQMPQISTAMSMLYALSMGNSGNAKGQLMNLVSNNYRALDEAEQVRLKDKCSGMYLLFLAPVLTASMKLIADMLMFLFAFMGQTG